MAKTAFSVPDGGIAQPHGDDGAGRHLRSGLQILTEHQHGVGFGAGGAGKAEQQSRVGGGGVGLGGRASHQ